MYSSFKNRVGPKPWAVDGNDALRKARLALRQPAYLRRIWAKSSTNMDVLLVVVT